MSSISSRFQKAKSKYAGKKRKYTTATRPSKTLQIAVAKAVQRTKESKFIDQIPVDYIDGASFSAISNVLSDSNSIYLINGIGQGDANYHRDGNAYKNMSLRLKMVIDTFWLFNVAGVGNSRRHMGSQTIRYAVVWDSAPNGSIPNFSQIFGSVSNAGVGTVGLNSLLQVSLNKRMRVLLDKTVVMNPSITPEPLSVTGGVYDYLQGTGIDTNIETQRYTCDHYLDFSKKDMESMCVSSGSSIANIITGAIYVVVKATNRNAAGIFSMLNPSATSGSTVWRLRFVDK